MLFKYLKDRYMNTSMIGYCVAISSKASLNHGILELTTSEEIETNYKDNYKVEIFDLKDSWHLETALDYFESHDRDAVEGLLSSLEKINEHYSDFASLTTPLIYDEKKGLTYFLVRVDDGEEYGLGYDGVVSEWFEYIKTIIKIR